MRRAKAAGWVAITLAAGCERPRTELVVRVESEVAWGPSEAVQSIVLTVRRGGPEGPLRDARTTTLGAGNDRRLLPLNVGVLAADDDTETPVWIEALGCAGPNGCEAPAATVAQRAVVRFARGQTREVPLLLASACAGVICEGDQRCAATGQCEAASRAEETVRPFMGTVTTGGGDGAVATDLSTDTATLVDAPGAMDVQADTAASLDAVDASPADAPGAMDVRADTAAAMDAVDASPAEVLVTPDRPDGGIVVDASGTRVDVPGDRPSADLGGACAEGSTRACYTGLPATRGVGICADGFQRCVGARWGVECNGETHPQVEVCNTIDDDCDGTIDNIQIITCYTGPPGTRAVGICHEGTQRCDGTTTPRCTGQVVPMTSEVCRNGMDDNCNGMSDEGCP